MCSPISWVNRLNLVVSLLPLDQAVSWLDLGCGTGKLFELGISDERFRNSVRMVGLDAVGGLLACAADKEWACQPPPEWVHTELTNAASVLDGRFDIVTMIGVLYQCGLHPGDALALGIDLVEPGGTLVATVENPEWTRARRDPDEIPLSMAAALECLGSLKDAGRIRQFAITTLNTDPLEFEALSESTCVGDWKEFLILAQK